MFKVYVGLTKRKLKSRIKEYFGSCMKGEANGEVKEDQRNDTELPFHLLQFAHKFNFDTVEVLEQELHCHSRLLKELSNQGKSFVNFGWMH